jgi:hypothetical protein
VSTGPVGADSSQPVRDLAVRGAVNGDVPVAAPGEQVNVPFDLHFAGARGAEFELAASGDLPGARLSLEGATLAPEADSDNPVSVRIEVPAGAAEGTYRVKLTATAVGEPDVIVQKRARKAVAGTQQREGTATFRVVAPPRQEPPPEPVPPGPGPEPVHPVPATPPPAPVPGPAVPPAGPEPRPVTLPARAKLHLSLSAMPRRAHNGTNASYLVIARTVSRVPARNVRVCVRLARMLQFLGTSRRARVRGRSVCFARIARLVRGNPFAARIRVHVDTDAWTGVARAIGGAVAANASRVRAGTGLPVRG